ncbi:MAG: trigger factor [Thermodesulfobacteriota bacterium]
MNKDNIKVELEELNEVKRKLDITVSADVVKEHIKEAYRGVRANASIAGFRKGTVPLKILKTRFADHVQEEVTKKLVEHAYPHALSDKGLAPIDAPRIDINGKLEEGKDFSFTAVVEVTPRVEVSGYKGMELAKEDVEVTDEDVEENIEMLRADRAQFKEVKRPAKDGDLVVVDFEGFLGKKPIRHGKSEKYPIIIGEKTLLPGFDEALKGASKGEEKETKIKFPENYSEEALRGKEGTFKIKVKSVREKVIPKIDAEFLKAVECESEQALRTRMREELKGVKEAQQKEKLKNEILNKLLKAHTFDVPDAMINRYLSATLGNVLNSMKQGGGNIEDRSLSPDELKAKYRKVAERQVREDIVLDSISAQERVEVTDEEINASVKRLAESRGVTFDALMTRIKQENALDVVKDGLKHEKVFDIIIGSSKAAS